MLPLGAEPLASSARHALLLAVQALGTCREEVDGAQRQRGELQDALAGVLAFVVEGVVGDPEAAGAMLRRAARDGNVLVARALLEARAVDAGAASDAQQQTPLHLTAVNDSHELVALFLAAGVAVDEHNWAGNTALHLAAGAGALQSVKLLLDGGSDKDRQTSIERDTPLILAAFSGKRDCVELLLEAGCKTDKQDLEGKTALVCAAGGGHEACVEALIAHGVDVSLGDKSGLTALMAAAQQGRENCARRLLKAGADVDAHDSAGRTALEHAVARRMMGCAHMLREWQARAA